MLTAMTKRISPDLPDAPFRGRDALAAGLLTPRQLRGSLFRPLLRGAYVRADARVTHRLLCRAAAVVAPPGAVITGRSAAEVLGVELASASDPVEIVVDEAERFGPVRGLLIKRTSLRPADSRPWDGIRLASPARMGFDLGRRPRLFDAVADLDAVIRSRALDPDALTGYLEGRTEHGTAQVRLALEMVDPRAESRPESMVRTMLRQAGLQPEVQFALRDRDGLVARFDLAFPEARVAVEYDGEWHALRMQLARDRSRMNRIDAAGWHVVFVTAEMLRGDPRDIVAAVRGALSRSNIASRR